MTNAIGSGLNLEQNKDGLDRFGSGRYHRIIAIHLYTVSSPPAGFLAGRIFPELRVELISESFST